MLTLFRADENLSEIEVSENPFSVKTERERAVEDKNMPVYRAMFRKKLISVSYLGIFISNSFLS